MKKLAKFMRSQALRLAAVFLLLAGLVGGSLAIWFHGKNTFETVSWFWGVVAGFTALAGSLLAWARKNDAGRRVRPEIESNREHLDERSFDPNRIGEPRGQQWTGDGSTISTYKMRSARIIDYHAATFVGRHDLLDRLSSIKPGQVILLEGLPAAGKTALITQLIRVMADTPGTQLAHFFVSREAGQTRSGDFVDALRTQFQVIAGRQHEPSLSGRRAIADLADLITRSVGSAPNPDNASSVTPEIPGINRTSPTVTATRVVLLVDGLDEQDNDDSPTISQALEDIYHPSIALIATARPATIDSSMLHPTHPLAGSLRLTLPELTLEDVTDLLLLRGLKAETAHEAAVRIQQASGGRALLVRFMSEDATPPGPGKEISVPDLPEGVVQYFRRQLSQIRSFATEQTWHVMETMAAAAGPMTLMDLSAFLKMSPALLNETMSPIKRYLLPGDDFQFSHELLAREVMLYSGGELRRDEIKRQLVAWAAAYASNGWHDTPPYVLQYHSSDLLELNYVDGLVALANPSWMQARFAAGGISGVMADLNLTLRAVASVTDRLDQEVVITRIMAQVRGQITRLPPAFFAALFLCDMGKFATGLLAALPSIRKRIAVFDYLLQIRELSPATASFDALKSSLNGAEGWARDRLLATLAQVVYTSDPESANGYLTAISDLEIRLGAVCDIAEKVPTNTDELLASAVAELRSSNSELGHRAARIAMLTLESHGPPILPADIDMANNALTVGDDEPILLLLYDLALNYNGLGDTLYQGVTRQRLRNRDSLNADTDQGIEEATREISKRGTVTQLVPRLVEALARQNPDRARALCDEITSPGLRAHALLALARSAPTGDISVYDLIKEAQQLSLNAIDLAVPSILRDAAQVMARSDLAKACDLMEAAVGATSALKMKRFAPVAGETEEESMGSALESNYWIIREEARNTILIAQFDGARGLAALDSVRIEPDRSYALIEIARQAAAREDKETVAQISQASNSSINAHDLTTSVGAINPAIAMDMLPLISSEVSRLNVELDLNVRSGAAAEKLLDLAGRVSGQAAASSSEDRLYSFVYLLEALSESDPAAAAMRSSRLVASHDRGILPYYAWEAFKRLCLTVAARAREALPELRHAVEGLRALADREIWMATIAIAQNLNDFENAGEILSSTVKTSDNDLSRIMLQDFTKVLTRSGGHDFEGLLKRIDDPDLGARVLLVAAAESNSAEAPVLLTRALARYREGKEFSDKFLFDLASAWTRFDVARASEVIFYAESRSGTSTDDDRRQEIWRVIGAHASSLAGEADAWLHTLAADILQRIRSPRQAVRALIGVGEGVALTHEDSAIRMFKTARNLAPLDSLWYRDVSLAVIAAAFSSIGTVNAYEESIATIELINEPLSRIQGQAGVAGRIASSNAKAANDLANKALLDLPFVNTEFNRRLGIGMVVDAFMQLGRRQGAWRIIVTELAESMSPDNWLAAAGQLAVPIGRASGALTLAKVTDMVDQSDRAPISLL